MDKSSLESRTRAFSVAIIKLSESASRGRAVDVLMKQLIRSATSIGANYREANRAESRKDFIHKISIVEKEAAETQYWLELLRDASLVTSETLDPTHKESSELLAIFTAIGRTTRKNSPASMQIRDAEGEGDFEFEISNFEMRGEEER